jgi:hypothetical protein
MLTSVTIAKRPILMP